jgi:hypothetical protein
MNPRHSKTIALSVTILAGLGLLVSLVYGRQVLSSIDGKKQNLVNQVRALATERDQIRTSLARRDTPPVQPAAQATRKQELEATLAQISEMRKANPPPSAHWKPYPRSTKGDVFSELLNDPDYVRHYIASQGLTLELQYADFFATTSASPEAVEKLKYALVQRSISMLERDELIAKHGVPNSNRGELSHMLNQKFDAEVRGILGEMGHTEFKRFEDTLIQRTLVTAFSERLSYGEEPLSNDQAAALVDIMETTPTSYGHLQIAAPKFNEAVITRAKAVLSPAQCEQLEVFQRERDAAGK